jgi:murein DD-endopeptidase MepM/ murein hydrolase activator NlpD
MIKKVSKKINKSSKKSKFIICLFLIATAGYLPFSIVANAEEGSGAAIDDINKQINEQRDRIDKLTKKIEEYKKGIATTQKEATSLNNQVKIIDNQIGKTNIDIEIKEEEITKLQLEIEKINMEISKNQLTVSQQKEQLSNIIRLLSRYSDKDYITVLLSNPSFSDFFDQVKYSENLQEEMQKTLNKVKENIENLNKKQKELNGKKEELSEVLNKLEEEKEILSYQKNTKNYLITQTKQSEKRFQSLVTDLKKEQNAANAAVATLEKKLRAELAKKSGEKFNSLSTARLDWPVTSRRITATFHDPTYPYRNLFEHSGIDFGIKQGTSVKAAEAGYVAQVGIGTKWYGNYIMIIHNNNLSTLYAHLSSVNVQADQYVSQGQLIGLSGNTGFSSGPHLHFEVRSNGVPVNPFNYLP